ncbi:hypothetical protein C1645_814355, partial [Glomus cerebriforme]
PNNPNPNPNGGGDPNNPGGPNNPNPNGGGNPNNPGGPNNPNPNGGGDPNNPGGPNNPNPNGGGDPNNPGGPNNPNTNGGENSNNSNPNSSPDSNPNNSGKSGGDPVVNSDPSDAINTIKTINPTATCASPNDNRCKAPPGITPKLETSTQQEVETITSMPTPSPTNDNGNDNTSHKITHWTTSTITTTITLYFAGFTKTITTTNAQGMVTTFATYIPPSTVLVVKKVVASAGLTDSTFGSDSITISHDFSHGLWGIAMSLAVVTSTLIFMIFA